MSFVDEIKQHKTLAIVAGTATLGAIAYSFVHKGSSSTSAGSNSVTSAGTGGSVPVQYLVPYSSYPSAGGAPNSGSTGTGSGGTTTTTSTSPSGIASSGGSGAGSGGTTAVSVPGNQPGTIPVSQQRQPHLPSAPAGYTQAANIQQAIAATRHGETVDYRNNQTGQVGVFHPGSGKTPPNATLWVPVSGG